MQELDKFNLKMNVLPNRLENHMRFTTNYKSCFIDSFQFLSSSVASSVKTSGKSDFKYLSQEFNNSISDLDFILMNI